MLPDLSSSGVPQAQIDVLAGLFDAASKKLADIVLHPPGKTANAQAFNQARAAQQLAQINQILQGLRHGAAAWIGPNVSAAFGDGVKRANQQAAEIRSQMSEVKPQGRSQKSEVKSQSALTSDLGPLTSSFSLIDHRTAAVFAHEIYADLDKAANSMGARATKVLRETRQQGLSESDINRILAGGVISGKPVETIRLLREELQRVHGQEVAIPTKGGGVINFDTGYYAELVARTKTRQATTVARHQRLESMELDLVSVTGRISQNFCTAYLGQVFSISGMSEKYPPLSSLPGGGPPFHPQCSKSTRPFIAALASPVQREQAEGLDDAEKLQNVSATEAQRIFKDLQLHAQVKDRYAHTSEKLYRKTG